MYKSLDVLYLTDESETIVAYEQRGRENSPSVSAYESGMQALQNMGRIPQVEAMHGRLKLLSVMPELAHKKVQVISAIPKVLFSYTIYW